MVRTYQDTYTFDYPWELLTQAVFQKYPNPMAAHVLASDVVDRWVDANGILHTTRLFLKTNSMPKWAKAIFPYTPETYILEQSSVDPRGREMRTRTWNITHTRTMSVEETQVLRPANQSSSPNTPSATHVETSAVISSTAGSGPGSSWLRSRIEAFGVGRFESNTAKSRKGILHVLAQLSPPPPQPAGKPLASPQPALARLQAAQDVLERAKKVAGAAPQVAPAAALGIGAGLVGAMGVVAAVVWGIARTAARAG